MIGHCILCDDTRWVCESHEDQPWTGPDACTCCGAGSPFPHCNKPEAEARQPRGFRNMFDNGAES